MNFMSLLRKKHSFSFVSPCKSKTTVQVQGKSVQFLRIYSHYTVHAYYYIFHYVFQMGDVFYTKQGLISLHYVCMNYLKSYSNSYTWPHKNATCYYLYTCNLRCQRMLQQLTRHSYLLFRHRIDINTCTMSLLYDRYK